MKISQERIKEILETSNKIVYANKQKNPYFMIKNK